MRLAHAIPGLLALAAAAGCTPDDGTAGQGAERTTTLAAAASTRDTATGDARRVVVAGVDLTGIGYDRGDPDAPLVVVELSDFGCPFCGSHARQTLPALEREYIATGKVFYKYVPIVMGMFPNGEEAARAAQCAAEQDAFWAMHDALYADQKGWKQARGGAASLFARYAAETKLDTSRFAACYGSDRTQLRSDAANARAVMLGVRATPTFFIDGNRVEGALPLDRFRMVLATLLRERGS